MKRKRPEQTAYGPADLAWFKSSHSDAGGGACVEVALEWRKSSYSDAGGGQCVEVAADWRKSSHSDANGGACVEVTSCPHTVHVRDSKQVSGPRLRVPSQQWTAFLTYVTA
ncbi:DUF397 domain-containing protein [Streptomyces sp. B1866]|uniref:DUF397 domain-containing protein n=1 Tax=Streptomyces sp. B1866 TaxID=3075431 RepID=UPI00288C90A9|nr:DUF397 domain-containing protein [Streptomyces sp. B1866]MDT3397604.1 DUF397 domain-containing protein [Streptomyces sp. B1866]